MSPPLTPPPSLSRLGKIAGSAASAPAITCPNADVNGGRGSQEQQPPAPAFIANEARDTSAICQRLFQSLCSGEAALQRQVEGGISVQPWGGARGRHGLPADLNLSKPWSVQETETFSRILVAERGKNFYAVQASYLIRESSSNSSHKGCGVWLSSQQGTSLLSPKGMPAGVMYS